MNGFVIFFLILLGVPVLNIISGFWLFRTKPEEQKTDDIFLVIILCFGVFLLPFYKVIKKERLIDFLEILLEQKQRDLLKSYLYDDTTTSSLLEKEIIKLERKIKLEKLN